MATRALKAEIPETLAARIADLADRMRRSTDSVVSEALSDWIDREDHERRMIEVGLADVDAGRVVDDEEVRAWADSLDTDNPLPVPRARR